MGARPRGWVAAGRRAVLDRGVHRAAHGRAARAAVARCELRRRRDPGAAQLQRPRRADDAQERQGPLGADGARRRPGAGQPRRPERVHRRAGPRLPRQRRRLPRGDGAARALQEGARAAEVRPLRFHDLRHTFGTLAIRKAEVPAVQAWMGHSAIQTTMRYVHHRDRGARPSFWPRRSRSSRCPTTRARRLRKGGAEQAFVPKRPLASPSVPCARATLARAGMRRSGRSALVS